MRTFLREMESFYPRFKQSNSSPKLREGTASFSRRNSTVPRCFHTANYEIKRVTLKSNAELRSISQTNDATTFFLDKNCQSFRQGIQVGNPLILRSHKFIRLSKREICQVSDVLYFLALINANGKLLTKTVFLSLRFSTTTEEKGLEKKRKETVVTIILTDENNKKAFASPGALNDYLLLLFVSWKIIVRFLPACREKWRGHGYRKKWCLRFPAIMNP